MPMNTSGHAAGVDRIMTHHARGYQSQMGVYIYTQLFPVVDIPDRVNNNVVVFDDQHFVMGADDGDDDLRAPGANVNTLHTEYETTPIGYDQYARAAKIPFENQEAAQQGPRIDMRLRTLSQVLERFEFRKEIKTAELARATSSYAVSNRTALSGTDLWSDDASKPKVLIQDAANTIRRATGIPQKNLKLEMGHEVFNALSVHPTITAHFSYTGRESVTPEMLAKYFDIGGVVVGEAIRKTKKGQAGTDIWGKDAILFYTPPTAMQEQEQPSFGYTYRHRGYPLVRPWRYDEDDESWKANVLDECRPYVTGMGAGFLIQTAVA